MWTVIALVIGRGYRQMHNLEEVGRPCSDDPPLPRVSIVVTAKNQERKVDQALSSLLGQKYPDYEVVYVNDRSDDRTGEIVERLRDEDDRIVPLHLSELPPGWFGKNHAAYRGSMAATGELFLFTDGDVVFEPNALESGVRHLLRRELHHLCATPRVRASGAVLQACVVVFSFLFFAMRPWKVGDPKSSAYAGIGAYNLMRGDAYHAIGGHKRIALRPDEDMQLGKLVKRSGLRSDVLIGDNVASVEWFASVKEFIRGGEKNAFAHAEYRISVMIGTTALLCCLMFLPFVLAPILIVTPAPGVWPLAMMFAIAAGLCWILSIGAAHAAGWPWWSGLLSPLATVIMIYTMWRSMLVNMSRGVEWGGPPIPLSLLRSNRVRATCPERK